MSFEVVVLIVCGGVLLGMVIERWGSLPRAIRRDRAERRRRAQRRIEEHEAVRRFDREGP